MSSGSPAGSTPSTPSNLTELGHVVIYVNQPEQELLPGAVLATGPQLVPPAVGGTVEFLEA